MFFVGKSYHEIFLNHYFNSIIFKYFINNSAYGTVLAKTWNKSLKYLSKLHCHSRAGGNPDYKTIKESFYD
jgi:hypothetical protein